MFDWKCPHCQKKFYSSSAERDKEYIDCCYCEKKMDNPYFEDGDPVSEAEQD